MCVAILKTKGNRITKKELLQAWKTNSDGAGIAWASKGKLNIVKSYNADGSMMDADTFVKQAVKLQGKFIDENMLIHFRIATQGRDELGNPDVANCHPFIVNKDVCFIHNGMINMPYSKLVSDTRLFNRDYLRALPFKFKLGNKAMRKLIENKIGQSKLIFLDSKGEYEIMNESFGTWEQGNWFSNRNHCPLRHRVFSFSNALQSNQDSKSLEDKWAKEDAEWDALEEEFKLR